LIALQFADADSVNGTRQKYGALWGCNGNNMVNILATHCWRLDKSFCRPNRPCASVQNLVGYAQNPSRHFV